MKIEYYLPELVYKNSDFEKEFPEWDAVKIEDKVGIRQRHIAAPEQTALDLAYRACEKLLDTIDRETIDFLLLCTQSPDYFLPTSACLLQDRLGLPITCGALDFNLGCSGFIYGLAMAKGLIRSEIANNAILVTSETYSKHIHPQDRANRSIFGDGAAATLLTKEDVSKIFDFELGTDGQGKQNLIVESGAMRKQKDPGKIPFIDENGNFFSSDHLYMNGPEIFNFTIEKVPLVVSNVLYKNNLNIGEIDYFIFHQANKYMLEYLRKKIKIPPEKFYNDILMTGNTVSATIPIAIKNAWDNHLIKSGNKLLLVGFGVGYSWGATIITL